VQALEQAASLNSDAQFLLTAYSQQGKMLLNHQQYQQALAVYEQAIHLAPNEPSLHFFKGNTLYALQEYEYDQAVRLDPQYAPGIFPQPSNMFECEAGE
jgi:tetratricopeptide (TPR) repeat protein